MRRLGATACVVLLAACGSPREAPPTVPPPPSSPPAPSDASTTIEAVDAGSDANDDAEVVPARRSCRVRDETMWRLRLTPREPARAHRAALVRAPLPGTLVCGRDGSLFLELTTREVRALLGEHATLDAVAGAGNAVGACGWSASVRPPTFMPPALDGDVARVRFDTDPKLELVHDLGPCTP